MTKMAHEPSHEPAPCPCVLAKLPDWGLRLRVIWQIFLPVAGNFLPSAPGLSPKRPGLRP